MTVPVPTDSELIHRTRQGDHAALETLVSRYEDRVYNLAYRMVRNREDAEDVLQDTFLSVVRALDKFREKSSFSTWLYRIAANAALSKLRQRSRKLKTEGEFLEEVYAVQKQAQRQPGMVDWSANPLDDVLGLEAKQVMEEAIEELPEDYRVVFVLRDVQGLPAAEVAEVLDLSVPAVKSRLHRARMFLRNRLSRYFTEEV